MDPQLFESKRSRVKFLEEVPTDDLFTQVDRCLSIQRAIREVNNKYSSRNKSVELISMTFTLLFKSYLFCYTVVATALRVMFSTRKWTQKG